MKALELKVPPVAAALLVAAGMWLLARVFDAATLHYPYSGWVGAALAGAGCAVGLAGVIAFRRARTTVDPLRPASASTVVNSGIYRFSRNPMYLGLLLALTGLAVHLQNLPAFALLPAFVLYMNRFQILPEERALASNFGAVFDTYRRSVRRWL